MTTVSKEEINSMKDLLTYFDGGYDEPTTSSPTQYMDINQRHYPYKLNESVDEEAVKAIKQNLSTFYELVDTHINTTIVDEFNPTEQEEIKNTTVLSNGLIYNKWECKFNKKTKEYIIRCIDDKQVICVLNMKETALLMLKLLKDKVPLTTSLAQMLFDFDRKYIQAKNDIQLYSTKGTMYEGRLQQAEILMENTQQQTKQLLKKYRSGSKLF